MTMNFNPISEFGLDILDNLAKQGIGSGALSREPLMLTTSGKPLPDLTLGKVVPVEQWAGGGYSTINNKKPVVKPKQTATINTVKNKSIPEAVARKSAIKNGVSLLPYIGDAVDIGQGIYQASHGHPYVGTGQAILGGAGLGANILFPGSGTIAKTGVKAAIKAGGKNAVKNLATISPRAARLIRSYAGYNRGIPGQILTTIAPNIYYAMSGDESVADDKNSSNPNENTNGNKSGNGGNTKAQQAQSSAINSNSNGESAYSDNSVNAILDYISRLNSVNQPYLTALQNYYNNYYKMLDKAQRANRFWQGVSSLTGNQKWADIADYYNPLMTEANKIQYLKQAQDIQAANMNAINEAMGDIAIAKELELPAETAFANKNLLTALTANRRRLTDWDKARLYDATKRYGYDSALNRALAVQNLRNQGNLAVANVYSNGGVAPGLNAQGTVNNTNDARYQQILNQSNPNR